MSRDPRDWRKDMTSSEEINPNYEKTIIGTPVEDVLEFWIQQAKTLKEDNARLTCQFTGAEQKYLTQSNVIAELRGRAEKAEEREKELKDALKYDLELFVMLGSYPRVNELKELLSTFYPLDREDTNE